VNYYALDIFQSRVIVIVVDVLGREYEEIKGHLFFHIYDDGTVENKIIA
jgi:hypothetical protein